MAAPRRAGPHREAEVPHRRGERSSSRTSRPSATRSSLAVACHARLGKDVVDLDDVSVTYPAARPARTSASSDIDVAHRARRAHRHPRRQRRRQVDAARPGRRSRAADRGRVKRGKTVKVATLTQQLAELERRRRRAGEHGDRPPAQRATSSGGKEVHARAAARAARLHAARSCRRSGEGPLRRSAPPAAAAADPARRAQRADPRRADERPRHRHARRDGGPPRLLAGTPARGQPRPLPHRAGHRPAVRESSTASSGTCPAASTSTSSGGAASTPSCTVRRSPTTGRTPTSPSA